LSKIIRSPGKDKVKSVKLNRFFREKKHHEEDKFVSSSEKSQLFAEKVCDEVKSKAATVLEEALQKAEEIKEEAFKRGYDEGFNKADEEATKLINTLKAIVSRAMEEKEEIIKGAEPETIKLAVEIAERIINEEIKVNPEVIRNVAKRALRLTVEREQLVIRLNPLDLEVIKKYREELISSVDGVKNMEIVGDQRIKRGGCVIETGAGNVDARVDSQLKQLGKGIQREALREQ